MKSFSVFVFKPFLTKDITAVLSRSRQSHLEEQAVRLQAENTPEPTAQLP
jgi:hypothetical protein